MTGADACEQAQRWLRRCRLTHTERATVLSLARLLQNAYAQGWTDLLERQCTCDGGLHYRGFGCL